MPSFRTPMEGAWEQDDDLNQWVKTRSGAFYRRGEAHWRGTWRVVWRNIAYEDAMRILYEVGAQDATASGTFLWTPRTRQPGDPQAIDINGDGVTDIVLEEVELKCRLTGGQPSTTPIFRSTADGKKVARLELRIESVQTFPERAGFGFPETINFAVEADAGDEMDISFLDADGNHSPKIAQVVIAGPDGETVDVLDYPSGLPYSFPSAQKYGVSVVSGSDFGGVTSLTFRGAKDDGAIIGPAITLPDLTDFKDLTALSGKRADAFDDDGSFAVPDSLEEVLFQQESGSDHSFGKLPPLRIFESGFGYGDSLQQYLDRSDGVVERVILHGISVPDDAIQVPDSCIYYEFNFSGTRLDLRGFSGSSNIETLSKGSVGDGSGSGTGRQADDLFNATSFRKIFNGKLIGVEGNLEVQGQHEDIEFYDADLDSYVTDWSPATSASNLARYYVGAKRSQSIEGVSPEQLPYVETTTSTTKTQSDSIHDAWTRRFNFPSGCTLIWTAFYKKDKYGALTQQAIEELIGTGIGRSTEGDGLIDYISAGSHVVQNAGAALIDADDGAQTVRFDLSQLPRNASGSYWSVNDLGNALATPESIRDNVFVSGNEFRIQATGSIDGVYRSDGATLDPDATGNEDLLEVAIDTNANSLPASDASPDGDVWCQLGDNPNQS